MHAVATTSDTPRIIECPGLLVRVAVTPEAVLVRSLSDADAIERGLRLSAAMRRGCSCAWCASES